MNAPRPLRLLALTLLLLTGSTTLHAVEVPAAEKLRETMLLPGVTLSEGVSEITGVAISPLLGVSVMGAWTYFKTEDSQRHRQPLWLPGSHGWHPAARPQSHAPVASDHAFHREKSGGGTLMRE